jgi:hypothetical protein
MFGRFFDTTAVDEFADWVVEELKRTLPASFDPNLQNVAQKVDRLDKRIAERTATFAKGFKLNLYQKARLAGRVQEGMNAHGYPKPFVETFSMTIVKRVMAVSRKLRVPV